jgi:hypothetical protein
MNGEEGEGGSERPGKPWLFRKGRKKTGGRRRGSRNRRDREREQAELIAREEIEAAIRDPNTLGPLELVLLAMKIRWMQGDVKGAVEFAEKVLPFTNAKLTASEVNVRHSLENRSEDDIRKELEALQAKAALVDNQPFLTIEARPESGPVIASPTEERAGAESALPPAAQVVDAEPTLQIDQPIDEDSSPTTALVLAV